MKPEHEKILARKILKLERPYPADDFILTYQDYLKKRKLLRYYGFNPVVLENLIKIANEVWFSRKRVARLGLLESIKHYFRNVGLGYFTEVGKYGRRVNSRGVVNNEIDMGARAMAFNFFKQVFENKAFAAKVNVERAEILFSSAAFGVQFSENEVQWLIDNAERSPIILNRVLRYPVKSPLISAWAKKNFHHIKFIDRRAEMISWILDEDQDFSYTKEMLWIDFFTMNERDREAISEFEYEFQVNKLLISEMPHEIYYVENMFGDFEVETKNEAFTPKMKLASRFYHVPTVWEARYQVHVPDFDTLIFNFAANIDTYYRMSMLWAVFYSRNDYAWKREQYKKYYHENVFFSLMKILDDTNDLELLHWIKARNPEQAS